MTETATKPRFPYVPPNIARLPVDPIRGYPVPWFVAWVDGKPEFRVADGARRARAIREKLCWVCGDRLGAHLAFLIGPMCAINRVTAEPPCQRSCAEYSVVACPFLSRPHMERRENGLPAIVTQGYAIQRNPGVTLLWLTKSYRLVPDGKGGSLLSLGDPTEVVAYAEGRLATHDEVRASIDSGLAILRSIDPHPRANAEIDRLAEIARKLLGVA